MVRNYKRKSKRQMWNKESLDRAVCEIIKGKMGYHTASVAFGVPKTTLERYVQKKRNSRDEVIKVKKVGSFKPVFTEEQEEELCEYVINMEQRLFGLTTTELRSLAFQLAERNKFNNPFNKATKLAGVDWLNGFLQRHPNIPLSKPEATFVARAMAFNKVSVGKYFELLCNIIDTTNITAERIFNVDETSITVNSKGHSRILAQKVRRQVRAATSAKRGETVTAVVCMSAAGNYMPPMLIFPRKRMQQEFEIGLPPRSWAEVYPSGWITKDLFLSWFKKFIDFAKPSKISPVLLLFDGYKSHTKNLALIDLAREKNVTLLCFPPHCSHRLQPLDVSFFEPLSKYYENAVRKWLRSNPGRVVTLFQIAALFGEAFIQSANMLTAISGFKESGAWPVDMSIFTEDDFFPPDPLALSANEENNENSSEDDAKKESERFAAICSNVLQCDLRILNQPNKFIDQPGTSTDCTVSSFTICSPYTLQPLPKVAQDKKCVSCNIEEKLQS